MNPAIAKLEKINLDVIQQHTSRFDNKTAPLYTHDGERIRHFFPKFRPPLFENGYVDGVRNSIEFQNAGTTSVKINGNWTILPGGSKKFDSSNEIDITSERFTVYFPDDPFNGLGGNRLEIAEIILADANLAHFKNPGVEFSE